MSEGFKTGHPVWSSMEAAIVTGGQCNTTWSASGVAINVQDVRPGDLFLAASDDDLSAVIKRGAAAIACSPMQAANLKSGLPVPIMEIGAAFMALKNLADAARFRTHAYVIGVQGGEARSMIAKLLAKIGQVHDGGHHISLGLANLPEDIDFGVFGTSPMVRPDIAVITNPSKSYRDTLFEHMPSGAAVLINADDPAHIDIVARARAANIETIVTYGISITADISLVNIIEADNGTRLSASIFGIEESIFICNQTLSLDISHFLCAIAIAKLTGRSIFELGADAPHTDQAWNNNAEQPAAVTLLDSSERYKPRAVVMQIQSLVDLGRGRQTAVLTDLYGKKRAAQTKTQISSGPARAPMSLSSPSLSLPSGAAEISILHTGRNITPIKNPQYAIQKRYGTNANVDYISTDVIAPGDFLVFREVWNSSKTLFSDALRCKPEKVNNG